jgi:hypothetical protein
MAIMMLELCTAFCLLLVLIMDWVNLKGSTILFNLAFIALQSLFVSLFFGSFLVEDYDNGFMDLLYFTGILILKKIYLNKQII